MHRFIYSLWGIQGGGGISTGVAMTVIHTIPKNEICRDLLDLSAQKHCFDIIMNWDIGCRARVISND